MVPRARIDLRDLLSKKAVTLSGHASAAGDPREDDPKKGQDGTESEPEVREPARESPPKHLPRPTRR